MLLTHYYHRDDAPFQTLSSLLERNALHIISNLSQREGSVYKRFRNPRYYLAQRQKTEAWVRSEFVRKGGQPTSLYPHYFVIERAVWIEEGYNGFSNIIQIPLQEFSPEQISFTYPDSMISYWLRDQRDKLFYHSEYHGQVFNLGEILNIIHHYGIPVKEWRIQPKRKYDLFIEAQYWDEIPNL